MDSSQPEKAAAAMSKSTSSNQGDLQEAESSTTLHEQFVASEGDATAEGTLTPSDQAMEHPPADLQQALLPEPAIPLSPDQSRDTTELRFASTSNGYDADSNTISPDENTPSSDHFIMSSTPVEPPTNVQMVQPFESYPSASHATEDPQLSEDDHRRDVATQSMSQKSAVTVEVESPPQMDNKYSCEDVSTPATDITMEQLSAATDDSYPKISDEEQAKSRDSPDDEAKIHPPVLPKDPNHKSAPENEDENKGENKPFYEFLLDEQPSEPPYSPESPPPSPFQSFEEIVAAKAAKQKEAAEANDSVGTPNSPAVDGALRASTIFTRTFPHGYHILQTSPEGLLCGMEAIYRSGKALVPEINVPTVRELQAIAQGEEYKDQNALFASEEEMMDNTNYFSADQLGLMLQIWGKTSGINLQLGYITEAGVPQLVPVGDEETAKIIWIHNDDAEARFAEFGYLGHWSGIKPRTAPAKFPKPVSRSATIHQQLLADRNTREVNLWNLVLESYREICPYSLLQQRCPLVHRCRLRPICFWYAKHGACLLENCYDVHKRYTCKSFIEDGDCDRLDDTDHREMFQHEGLGKWPEDQELDWTSREAHAALRETHVLGRY